MTTTTTIIISLWNIYKTVPRYVVVAFYKTCLIRQLKSQQTKTNNSPKYLCANCSKPPYQLQKSCKVTRTISGQQGTSTASSAWRYWMIIIDCNFTQYQWHVVELLVSRPSASFCYCSMNCLHFLLGRTSLKPCNMPWAVGNDEVIRCMRDLAMRRAQTSYA